MRKYKRQVARWFMKNAGVGNVNRKMGKLTRGGVKVWRFALMEYAKKCRKANPSRRIRKAARA